MSVILDWYPDLLWVDEATRMQDDGCPNFPEHLSVVIDYGWVISEPHELPITMKDLWSLVDNRVIEAAKYRCSVWAGLFGGRFPSGESQMSRTMHDAGVNTVPADSYMKPGDVPKKKPTVVTLCGSTKFKEDFERVQKQLTFAGCIVISVGCFGHADKVPMSDAQKEMLDELHKRKIDISDEIVVINKGGYVGSSTRSEIEYATKHGKEVVYMEDPNPPKKTLVGTSNWVADMADFHNITGDQLKMVRDLSAEKRAEFFRFRKSFLMEEMVELESAKTPEDAVDAIIDMLYVGVGTLHLFGVDVEKAWAAVHAANMTKHPGVNPTRPNPFGFPDYIKPPGWKAPTHEGNHGELTAVFNYTNPHENGVDPAAGK